MAAFGPGPIRVPNMHGLWTAACNFHDNCYGSYSTSRMYCDWQFYHLMVHACSQGYDWWNPARYGCYEQATTYFLAVRGGGTDLFIRGHYDACRRRRYSIDFCTAHAVGLSG